MRMQGIAVVVGAALAALNVVGCTPAPSAVAATINDKVYPLKPDSVTVRGGLVTGEVTEMKVTERVEEGSGRITAAAKLTGKLLLKNVSTDQTVRIVGGKFTFLDLKGQPIKMEDNRSEPVLKMTASYNAPDRLDPGQEVSQLVDVDFPAEALKAKTLKDIRLQLSYIPSPYREQALNFGVSIGAQ